MKSNTLTQLRPIVGYSLLWLIPLIWAVTILLVSHHSGKHFSTPNATYYRAAHHFLQSKPLYRTNGTYDFIYFPQMAILYAPFSLFPFITSAIIFRIFSVIVFAVSLFIFSRQLSPIAVLPSYRLLTLIGVLLSQGAVAIGQMHVITVGLLMIAFSLIAQEKWWQAAFFLVLSLALKPTAIVLFLLAPALYPKLRVPVIALFCGAVLFPCLLRPASYIWAQYLGCVHDLLIVFHMDVHDPKPLATLFGAILFYTEHSVPNSFQIFIRVTFALLTLVLGFLSTNYLSDKRQSAFVVFSLGIGYLILFNYGTQNNDYIMLAPVIGLSLIEGIHRKEYFNVVVLLIVLLGFIFNWSICKFLGVEDKSWLKPTLTVFYLLAITVPTIIRGVLTSRTITPARQSVNTESEV